jgi:acyl carrier protein
MRNYLVDILPDYMIPTYFVSMDKLPINANGKIDRKALPLPQYDRDNNYVAPANEIERKLVAIWSDVLAIPNERISTNASFFDIGGHSLNATIVLSRITKEFNIKISFVELLRTPTIQNTAMIIFQFSNAECISEEIEI